MTIDEAFAKLFEDEPAMTQEQLQAQQEIWKKQMKEQSQRTNKKLQEEYAVGDLCCVSLCDLQNNRWVELALMYDPEVSDQHERQVFVLGELSWFPIQQIHKTKEEAIEWNSQ